jgi:hypothetical protein
VRAVVQAFGLSRTEVHAVVGLLAEVQDLDADKTERFESSFDEDRPYTYDHPRLSGDQGRSGQTSHVCSMAVVIATDEREDTDAGESEDELVCRRA